MNGWLDRIDDGASSGRLLRAFERGFAAVWQRAHQTLGEVTLFAIVDRVLHDTTERFSFFSSVEIEAAGLRCQKLHERAEDLPRDDVAAGIRSFLVEFLTVLGNLTAEILTPALHAALSQAAHDERRRDETGSHGEPTHNDGDAQS